MAKFCRFCGRKLRTGSERFCPGCGSDLLGGNNQASQDNGNGWGQPSDDQGCKQSGILETTAGK